VTDPKREYEKRLEARTREIAEKERTHVRAGNAKLGVLIAGFVLAWAALGRHWISSYWIFAAVAAFAALFVWHERVLRAKASAERGAAFYRRGIARIEDHWAGTGATGERFLDEKHVYAEDLDLFGRGSLFDLISAARTPMGEERLAAWLLEPAAIPTILERQGTIGELRERVDFREDLALVGEELRGELNPKSLTEWAEGARSMPMAMWRMVALALAAATIVTLAWGGQTSNFWPFVIALGVTASFRRAFRKRSEQVLGTMDSDPQGLDLFSKTVARIEREMFESPRLGQFARELKADGAAAAIGRLAKIAYWIEARESFMFHVLDFGLLLTVQTAYAAEGWRTRWGKRVRTWIEAVAEIEAVVSLAGYAYEHPGDPFPEFATEEPGAAFLDGEELKHPLIPAARSVGNSVRLDAKRRLLIVSGSNMSGKSTLLRAVGVNAVLAMAGAPIRGKSLRMGPLTLGTRIRSVDSLLEGRSNFYTEILRIRQVFDRTGQTVPVLFLFDELLEGTNSKDRRIGAEGLLRAFVGRGAIGIVTTHDLALTEIVREMGEAAGNAHFEDRVVDGEMRFDYQLRPGVVERSNAIELMRLVGLNV
jgi:hypothetical protein